MTKSAREQRLATDLETLRALKKSSSIFDFECTGDPPDRYTLIFRGRGISHDTSPSKDIEYVELHRCDLRLSYSYPDRPPDIRWRTATFHPNISLSGFINTKDIRLPWEKALTLDVLCERLWDVIRLAFIDLEKSPNYAARSWFEENSNFQVPVDHRPLSDSSHPISSNVVRYERRSGAVALGSRKQNEEVFFIGDETPTPDLPEHCHLARRRTVLPSDDGVFFIDDE